MKQKLHLLLIGLLLVLLAACGSVQGNEPAAGDGQPVGSDVDPDQPASSDDPLPPTAEPQDEGDVIVDQANVEAIQIMILESFPVQVRVAISGFLPDGCTEIGDITTEFENDAFSVNVATRRPADMMCTQQIVEFEESVALDVHGLAAGTYTVDVNGVTDQFELAVDNELELPGAGDGDSALVNLPPADQAELIRLTLERALVAQEIPDYQLLVHERDVIVLSTENIDANLAPEVEGHTLLLLSPEEIQAKANEEGDFPYLRFQQFNAPSDGEAMVSLGSAWATAEDSEMIYLSGGGFTIEYSKGADGWTGEVTENWIS